MIQLSSLAQNEQRFASVSFSQGFHSQHNLQKQLTHLYNFYINMSQNNLYFTQISGKLQLPKKKIPFRSYTSIAISLDPATM